MSKRGFKKKDNGGSPSWLTTYSDLMSLLLTFFILLFSMSTVDAKKFKDIAYSLQSVLTGLGGPYPIEGGTINDIEIPNVEHIGEDDEIDFESLPEEVQEMYGRVVDYIGDNELEAKVTVNANRRGVFVDIKEAILFEPGKAELKESGLQVLKRLEGLVNDFDNELVIEGHTDDVPMNSRQYPSNWELSTARAVTVVRYLIDEENVAPNRLSAVGYGEYRPIVPNDSAANRSTNRRVNILIIINGEGEINGSTNDSQ
ncbi:flagellar motor protein MotB [Paratissierella segnis]|jgi:chemotaxis protein MotB|uniref:OmpA family protein n=1 Tax=Paratissierella segnis TaxID=2763679 RepID=A0A926EVF3_9FIRM|nr:flagellar motor protein MotB [Paratissierella segnis]MBC8588336.1 OmpA family protein [Paratissierella segnis]